jgi:hypothetical protein
MTMEQTISNEYLELQKELHKNPAYGVASLSFAPFIADLITQLGIKSISDYGAGKKNLLKGLESNGITEITYFPYDPVFPDYGQPQAAELVCCIDVLEHIEPDLVKNVLNDLEKIVDHIGFFSIHTGPAKKILADGRNAHLIQKSTSWWLPLLCEHFEIIQLQHHQYSGEGFWVLVERKSPIANS